MRMRVCDETQLFSIRVAKYYGERGATEHSTITAQPHFSGMPALRKPAYQVNSAILTYSGTSE